MPWTEREHFVLQSDLDEFAAYRATLAQATHRAGDTSAAQTILGRYLQRLEQRNAHVTNILKTASFDFTGHDVYSFDREHAQRPRDQKAAQELWQQQLRAEYLQEKLGDVRSKQIVDTLTRRYAQQLHTMQALRSDEVLEIYLNALAHVYDPHSGYLGHSYDPGALKITVRKFYRPSGASTQLRGAASDIVLPSTSDFSDVSESAMKDPLPWDAVRSVPYEHLNRVEPYVDTLREKSVRRVTTKKDFVSLADDVARLKKSLATKAISLNEAERRQELAQSKAREIEREKEDKRLRATRPTTYEITLKNASSPGLPRPFSFTDHPGTAGATTSSSAQGALDGGSTGRSSANDIILNECVQILADYVRLLSRPIIATGVRLR